MNVGSFDVINQVSMNIQNKIAPKYQTYSSRITNCTDHIDSSQNNFVFKRFLKIISILRKTGLKISVFRPFRGKSRFRAKSGTDYGGSDIISLRCYGFK